MSWDALRSIERAAKKLKEIGAEIEAAAQRGDELKLKYYTGVSDAAVRVEAAIKAAKLK